MQKCPPILNVFVIYADGTLSTEKHSCLIYLIRRELYIMKRTQLICPHSLRPNRGQEPVTQHKHTLTNTAHIFTTRTGSFFEFYFLLDTSISSTKQIGLSTNGRTNTVHLTDISTSILKLFSKNYTESNNMESS